MLQALTSLEFISEARAATPPDKKHGGHQKAASAAPAMSGISEYEFHYTSIENMVKGAERGVEIARRRQKVEPETVAERRARILKVYRNETAQKAADIEGLS